MFITYELYFVQVNLLQKLPIRFIVELFPSGMFMKYLPLPDFFKTVV